jgi:8-hydroxy-5-deazaflavin:NADPH oxidoreductase
MFVCGDDADAKKVVTDLVAELGLKPVATGPLTQARYLEPPAMLWISMAYRFGQGPNFGFHVVGR